MLLSTFRTRAALQTPSHTAARHLHAGAPRPVPPPRASTPTAPALLAALGRGCASKLKVHDWAALWQLGRAGMKAAGVGARDRRYILWSLEKYRQGLDPAAFAHPEPPKKKIRSWGPAVQFGKRIRSRRRR